MTEKRYLITEKLDPYTHRRHVQAVVVEGQTVTRLVGRWEVFGPLTRRFAQWRASRAIKADISLRKASRETGR